MVDGAPRRTAPHRTAPHRAALRAAQAAPRSRGTEGEKPLWPRDRGVVPRRVRLRKGARVVVQGARVS
jgi:hypothetical protein